MLWCGTAIARNDNGRGSRNRWSCCASPKLIEGHSAPHFGTWEAAVSWLRTQPDQRQLVLDAFYDDPLISAAKRYFEVRVEAVSRLLQGRIGRALDVGAGRGIASYALGRAGFVVTALDPIQSNRRGSSDPQVAAEADLSIEVVEEFSERLPFADASFDVVFARAVLHHTRDLNSACLEMHRVLKPGGIFIAAREHVISREADLEKFLEQHPLHHLYGGRACISSRTLYRSIRCCWFCASPSFVSTTSSINLFPHTLESLREGVVESCRKKCPRNRCGAMLRSNAIFKAMLSVAERFDNRPDAYTRLSRTRRSMSIWVTGAKGLVGGYLARGLANAGHEVHGIGHGALEDLTSADLACKSGSMVKLMPQISMLSRSVADCQRPCTISLVGHRLVCLSPNPTKISSEPS